MYVSIFHKVSAKLSKSKSIGDNVGEDVEKMKGIFFTRREKVA